MTTLTSCNNCNLIVCAVVDNALAKLETPKHVVLVNFACMLKRKCTRLGQKSLQKVCLIKGNTGNIPPYSYAAYVKVITKNIACFL